jgi:L-ascorbate metabolism protein UlaG (beta-lactamase superfamily)
VTTQVINHSAFLQDIKRARKADETFHIWWLGGHGFLLKWQDRCLIMDPVLSAQTNHPQGAQTAQPGNGERASVVAPVDLNFIDVTTVTRPEDGLLDRATVRGIWTVSPAMRLVMPKASCPFAAKHLGIHPALPIGLEDGETVKFADIEITALALNAAGSPGMSPAFAYIYRIGQGFTCFHASRIETTDEFAERVKAYNVDMALLPIAAESSATLDNTPVIEFAKKINAKQIIPHTGDSLVSNPRAIDTFAEQAAQAELSIHILQPGQRWSNAK